MNHRGPGSGRSPGARLLSALVAGSLAAALAGCTPQGDPRPEPQESTQGGTGSIQGGIDRQPQLDSKLDLSLEIPWAVVFLEDGTAIISERDSAKIKMVRDGRASDVGTIPKVDPGGEGGLLGLALSPGFREDRYLYSYYTSATDNRIARSRLEQEPDGRFRLGPTEVIFEGMSKASTHNGGRIRFGPDGFLYVGTGDSQRRNQPQDRNALGGKILRLTPDGKPAPGNPFGDNPVYSYGHRNVQGLAWDGEGRLWASEFGPDVNDELNLIVPGGNYGWPEVTGAPGRPGFIDAKVVWRSTAESSPSGLAIVGNEAYLGALRGRRLWSVSLDGESAGEPVAYFTQMHGRLRDVALAPDGRLWVLTNNQNPDFALIYRLPN
ncbi:PQQ-dependent sugar dehydrogenase [Arthrobacter sp. ISL-30]|uniref:PQQ-dependent sugar dehydrogenase n=1 Tax=Arthrobacter sp. ISL-30 TaxID=2819109 RepID=UPI001BED2147|nr:PQQ-dependent sugar dehydrogenase [Arthrobacter sp. ISL-30]MBT2514022.1 PQQ-dependent sugar dehydrogenase [Arthrobacter sp. ISL-30]